MTQGPVIQVRSAWNAWRAAEVLADSLEDIHWLQPSGAPRRLVHGYTWCTHIVGGEIPHGCSGTDGPHRLLVCVLKHDASPTIHSDLSRRADVRAGLSAGFVPVVDRVAGA
jgi:hypothetical protein